MNPGWALLVRGPLCAWCEAPPSPVLQSWCTALLTVRLCPSPFLLSIAPPLQLPPKHQAMLRLCLVLRGLLPVGDGELLCSRAQGRVSSTSIPCLPSSQASRRFSIRRWMASDEVACQARFSITIWKTMNRSESHCMSRIPRRSPPSVTTNRFPNFPLGAS